jgi:hypothetical protein
VTGGLLTARWAGFVLLAESWWQLAVAAFLAVVFTQTGFLGHDAGHRQIFRSRRAAGQTRPPVALAGTRMKREVVSIAGSADSRRPRM